MKKNLLLAIVGCGGLLLSANTAKAQEAVVVEESVVTEVPVECKTNYSTSWKDNWYIQAGAGMMVPYVDHYNVAGHAKRHITAIYNVGVGHWFSPYLGVRATGFFGKLHTDCGPKADRAFSIIPYVGLGVAYTHGFRGDLAMIPTDGGRKLKTKEVTLPVAAGLQLRLRLCDYVDFFAEARANFYGDNFDNVSSGKPIESTLMVYGGLSFNLGKRNYKAYNPCEYVDYINSLNNQVNDLRGALATTAAALAAAEAQLPCPEVQAPAPAAAPLLATVRFKINSAVITDEEAVNVYNVAQWMKANPEAKVYVQGYADKDTGTAAYNMELSQRRGQSVVDALVNQYGIDPSRLTIQANGSDVQPYETNDWNRIVIFTQP